MVFFSPGRGRCGKAVKRNSIIGLCSYRNFTLLVNNTSLENIGLLLTSGIGSMRDLINWVRLENHISYDEKVCLILSPGIGPFLRALLNK